MATVLVTGGTGTLGRHLVPVLEQQGHQVRALSRRSTTFPGDVRTGHGLAGAAEGVDVVIHAASSPFRKARETEVEGIRNVLRAAGDAHVVYVSIVGVDRHRFPYYKAKRAAEVEVERHSGPWTIQRGTQFHELLDALLSGRAFVRTPHLAFQPIAAADFAAVVAAHVETGPAGRAPDAGGPEVLDIRQLAETRRRIAGAAARLVPAPRVGPIGDYDAGLHLCPERAVGATSWEAWLQARHA